MTFEDFYRMRRGFAPFPWMERLAARFAEGDLPSVIDLPTGSGKSDLVLIWAWARTQRSELPRRLWMISDRRVIVDQTFEVAKRLEGDGILVSRLRGGLNAETQAILDPVASQVICATVDQFGSRLLFRGYGAPPTAWPIWAGLAGNDSLIVLDEAHLSPTAEDTFRACQRLGANVKVISMTATPEHSAADRLTIADDDRAHPILGPRLRTRRLVELRPGGALVEAAHELLSDGCLRVAVICNTVREARRVFDAIKHSDKHLIIGRQRPIDRDRLMAELLPRLISGAAPSQPLVVVATQCVEAGADFDFDGMASEACPIDALRQRLGRLDRLGAKGEGRCILTMPAGARWIAPYGTAPIATWRWLRQQAKRNVVDLVIEAWPLIADGLPDDARSSRPAQITLLEPHMRALAITSPRPTVEPDVDLLLHGPGRASGAVTLVWRHDVDGDAEAASEILSIMPPSATETCDVPMSEALAWLSGTIPEIDAGDVEGATLPESESPNGRSVLRWDGAEQGATLIPLTDVRPGDLLVLRTSVGGYDRFGWAPASTADVEDVADEAFERRTGRPVTRHDGDDIELPPGRVYRWRRGAVVVSIPRTASPRAYVEVPLDTHADSVARQAEAIGQALDLDAEVLHLAGLHHDDGKADQRWQICIKGGNIARLGEPPLAKGNYVPTGLARLPKRWRHEAESLRRLPDEAEPIVKWLVATHHGFARPFWPTREHGIGLADIMTKLQSEYGFWGLALYEAALRYADRHVSRQEEMDAGL